MHEERLDWSAASQRGGHHAASARADDKVGLREWAIQPGLESFQRTGNPGSTQNTTCPQYDTHAPPWRA
jgi:hypothetical protein